MKKKYIVCILVAVMIIGIVAILVNLSFQKDKENENNTTNEVDIYDEETINEIKEEINATADTDMYQIQKEYDGRQISNGISRNFEEWTTF